MLPLSLGLPVDASARFAPAFPPRGHAVGGDHRPGDGNGSWSVLLVEDNPADADLVREMVSPYLPCNWMHVRRLDAALQALDEADPDVVLLDIGLPDSRGLDTLESIQAAAGDVPVVVLTGHDDAADAAEAVRRGAQEYVSKQMMTEALLVRVMQHSIERQRLLRQARGAEQRLRDVIEANRDALVVLDGRGVVLLANPAAEELLVPAGGSLRGASLPFDPAAAEAHGEVTLSVPSRGDRILEVRTGPIDWEGSAARLVSARDVTARHHAEQLRRRLLHSDRLRSIGELAAGVAHEINNPAALVLSNTEALAGSIESVAELVDRLRAGASMHADASEAAETIDGILAEMRDTVSDDRTAVLRVRSIVRSLRVFSRVDRDHVEAVRLDELVADACTMVSNEIRHRARLVSELEAVPPIQAEPGKLTQVAVNLLVNAAQAIPEGAAASQRVTVRTRDDGSGVVLEVQDTGTGIPDEIRERIFEPFYTSKPRGQGTGLGLSLSLEIVRQHGGEMTVESEPGAGSVFRVRFPYETGLRASAHPSIASLGERAKGARVLLIDDEAGLLRALRRVLRAEHDVVSVAGGQEALDLLERDRDFDAVVCDLMMPDVDGVAVCVWLESHAPELLRRTALMSGGALTDRTRSFVDRADIALLEKPASADELKDVVHRLASYSGEGSSDG